MNRLTWAVSAVVGCVALGCTEPEPSWQSDDPVGMSSQAIGYGVTSGNSVVPFGPGMDLGRGFDELSQRVLSQAHCLDYPEAEPGYPELESESYVTEQWKLQLASDKTELRELLDIQASLAGTFGVVRVGLSGGYYDESETTNDTLYLVVAYDVTTRVFRLKKPIMSLDGLDGKHGRPNNRRGEIARIPNSEQSTVRYIYANDVESFRRRCGDAYIHGVVTGGRYVAVLEVKGRRNFSKQKVWGKLQGTYLPYMLTVEGNFNVEFQKLEADYDLSLRIASRGTNHGGWVDGTDSDTSSAQKVTELYRDIARFKQDVLASDAASQERDPSGRPSRIEYRRGALRALLASYAPTAHEVTQAAPKARSDSYRTLRRYESLLQQYDALEANYAEVAAHPERFDGPADGLGASRMRHAKQRLELESMRCMSPGSETCFPVEQLVLENKLLDPFEVETSLPRRKPVHARTCREVKSLTGARTDGDYTLYMDGDPEAPYSVWCEGMADDGAAPVQYLNLACVDPTVSNPGANFSGVLRDPAFNGGAARGRFWIYDKLRVHVNPDHLVVVPGQTSFVRVVGESSLDRPNPVPWGYAESCATKKAEAVWLPDSTFVAGNVNLKGTPFYFAAVPTYRSVVPHDPSVADEHQPPEASDMPFRIGPVAAEDPGDPFASLLQEYNMFAWWDMPGSCGTLAPDVELTLWYRKLAGE